MEHNINGHVYTIPKRISPKRLSTICKLLGIKNVNDLTDQSKAEEIGKNFLSVTLDENGIQTLLQNLLAEDLSGVDVWDEFDYPEIGIILADFFTTFGENLKSSLPSPKRPPENTITASETSLSS